MLCLVRILLVHHLWCYEQAALTIRRVLCIKKAHFYLKVFLPRLSAMLTGKLQIHIGRDHRHHTLNLSGVGSVGSAGNVAQIDQCIKGMFLSSSSHHTS